jgi:hypothetical protein
VGCGPCIVAEYLTTPSIFYILLVYRILRVFAKTLLWYILEMLTLFIALWFCKNQNEKLPSGQSLGLMLLYSSALPFLNILQRASQFFIHRNPATRCCANCAIQLCSFKYTRSKLGLISKRNNPTSCAEICQLKHKWVQNSVSLYPTRLFQPTILTY